MMRLVPERGLISSNIGNDALKRKTNSERVSSSNHSSLIFSPVPVPQLRLLELLAKTAPFGRLNMSRYRSAYFGPQKRCDRRLGSWSISLWPAKPIILHRPPSTDGERLPPIRQKPSRLRSSCNKGNGRVSKSSHTQPTSSRASLVKRRRKRIRARLGFESSIWDTKYGNACVIGFWQR